MSRKMAPIMDKPASGKAPAGIKTLGVSPVKTIKGPSIHSKGSTGPKGTSGNDKSSSHKSR